MLGQKNEGVSDSGSRYSLFFCEDVSPAVSDTSAILTVFSTPPKPLPVLFQENPKALLCSRNNGLFC